MRKLVFLALGVALAAGGCNSERQDEPELPPVPTNGVTIQQLDAFQALETKTTQKWAWLQHDELKTPLHLSTKRTGARVLLRGEDAHKRTLAVLEENKALFKMRRPDVELSPKKTEKDHLGMAHARFQQMTHGVPVANAEVMAHYDEEGHLTSIDANYVSGLDDVDVNPRFDAKEALAIVKADVTSRSGIDETLMDPEEGKLVVYAAPNQPGRLAYEYTVHALAAEHPAIWVITVDAHSGVILDHYNNLQTVQATGKGVLGDSKTFEVSNGNGGLVMSDTSTGVQIQTFSAEQQEVAPGAIVSSTSATTWDADTTTGPGAAVDAHFNATQVAKYYKTVHNRNAIDGLGGPLRSTVHFGKAFDNAAWIKTGMIYGDGGKLFRALSVGVDVVGHEFTHGVIEKTSALVYKNQPGALNEAIADIFGAFIEHSVKPDVKKNWTIGEQLPKAAGTVLRDMTAPVSGLDPQPTHMNQFVQTTQDEGGVHINSGIVNNAAYLMTVGGTNSVSKITIKAGIGWEKAEKLWYRANTTYFMSSTNFAGAAAGVMSAAKDVGLTQNEQNIVDCAFKATGIVTGTCATITGTTPGETPPPGSPTTPTGEPSTSGGTGDVPDETPDRGTTSTETKKPSTRKKKAVVTETDGCNSTGAASDAGSSLANGLLAVLGIAALFANKRRRSA